MVTTATVLSAVEALYSASLEVLGFERFQGKDAVVELRDSICLVGKGTGCLCNQER
jgi:hypothetical protein